jgi:2,3-bisphosphoglycerate-dependent phosphoglycerate mutase
MEKHVYLVRHGESESNAGNVHIGPSAPLTLKGREQARLIAERVAHLSIDTLLSSTFPRAVDTAATIAQKVDITPEQNALFGEFEGPSSLHGMHRSHPDFIAAQTKISEMVDDPNFRLHDEETFVELIARGTAALEYLAVHPGERICVVTHGGFLRLLVGIILFRTDFTKKQLVDMFKNFATANTGLTYIKHDEEHGWRLLSLNDRAHLG